MTAVPALARLLAAALCGASWSVPSGAAVAPLVVIVWWQAPSRRQAWGVGFAYQLGATWSLASAAGRFAGGGWWMGALLVVGGSALAGLGWAWAAPAGVRSRLAPSAALVAGWVAFGALPWLGGAFTVAHPLAAAGRWFPGLGWFGLWGMALAVTAARTRAGAWAVGALSLLAVVRGPERVRLPPDVRGVATALAPASGPFDFARQFDVATASLAAGSRQQAPLVVLPEGAAGTWSRPMASVWAAWSSELARDGRAALVGASLQVEPNAFDNVLVGLGTAEGVRVAQRLPIPGLMWRPWASSATFRAHPLDAAVAEVGGQRVGVLICWEGALLWPAMRTLAAQPDVLVLAANHGWTGPREQTRRAVEAWGALFGLPVVVADNRGGDDA